MSLEERFLQAMKCGDVVVVDQMLKSKEVDVNKKLNGSYILTRGIDCGNPDVVACIIENGADLDTLDVWDRSPLHWAIVKYNDGYREAKQQALKVLCLTVEAYKRMGSQKLMQGAFIVRENSYYRYEDTAFLAAIRGGLSDVVLILLDLINDETVQFLNVDQFTFRNDGSNPFHYVDCLNEEAMDAVFDRLPFKEQMINKRNADGFTPLNFVIDSTFDTRRCHRRSVLLLNNGANPNLPDKIGRAPLHWAIDRGSTSVCEVLLRAGSLTDILDTRGISALKMAILSHHPGFPETTIKFFKLLLTYGVDLDKEPYLYADDELPVEYRRPEFEDQVNTENLQVGLLEKLRELRRSSALNSLQHRCRVAVLRNLKINEMKAPEQRNGNDVAIDSLPLPDNMKFYLRGDGDKVLATLDSWLCFNLDL